MSSSIDFEVAEAVEGLLKSNVWSQAIQTSLYVLPNLDVKSMAGFYASVLPSTRRLETLDRGSDLWSVGIDIAVQKRCGDDIKADVKATLALAQSIQKYFHDNNLPTMPEATCIEATSDPIYLPSHLKQAKVATSVIACVFDVTAPR